MKYRTLNFHSAEHLFYLQIFSQHWNPISHALSLFLLCTLLFSNFPQLCVQQEVALRGKCVIFHARTCLLLSHTPMCFVFGCALICMCVCASLFRANFTFLKVSDFLLIHANFSQFTSVVFRRLFMHSPCVCVCLFVYMCVCALVFICLTLATFVVIILVTIMRMLL